MIFVAFYCCCSYVPAFIFSPLQLCRVFREANVARLELFLSARSAKSRAAVGISTTRTTARSTVLHTVTCYSVVGP